MFRFKLTLIVHFLSVCVVSTVASGEHVGLSTELPKYYAQLQTAVAHGLGWPAGPLAGHHTDAAPKHSLLFQFSFRRWSHSLKYICKAETLAFTDCDLLDISAVNVVIVIIAICDMP